MKTWKACERRVAELQGGVRAPVSGRCRGDTSDVLHPDLSIEVKSRKQLPAWLENATRQAEAAAIDGQLPVVVLHEKGKRYKAALVVIRLENFVNASVGAANYSPGSRPRV